MSDVREEALDSLIALACHDYAEEHSAQIWEELSHTDVTLSVNLVSQIRKRVRIFKMKHRIAQFKSSCHAHKSLVAASLVLIVAMALTTINVDAVRVRWANFTKSIEDGVTELKLHPHFDSISPGDINGIYIPEYIPEGFTISEKTLLGSVLKMDYNRDGDWIEYIQKPNEKSVYHVDSDEPQEIFINGLPGEVSAGTLSNTIVWYSETLVFSIDSNLSVDEITRIAESVIIS